MKAVQPVLILSILTLPSSYKLTIDLQLQSDCHQIAKIGDLVVLLNRNAIVPWFILVPDSASQKYRELFELPHDLRNQLDSLSDAISQYLIEEFSAYKINTAAIGNVVEQLHFHIVGRYLDDCCWPKPVWGNLTEQQSYTGEELKKITSDITKLINNIPLV